MLFLFLCDHFRPVTAMERLLLYAVTLMVPTNALQNARYILAQRPHFLYSWLNFCANVFANIIGVMIVCLSLPL